MATAFFLILLWGLFFRDVRAQFFLLNITLHMTYFGFCCACVYMFVCVCVSFCMCACLCGCGNAAFVFAMIVVVVVIVIDVVLAHRCFC